MPQFDLVNAVTVERSPRVMQLEGLFDIPPTRRSESRWAVTLPLDDFEWNIGLIVGPSGSGKSTLAREAFARHLVTGYAWPGNRSIVDAFPREQGIKEITALLSSVGFSSPPAWLRPFRCLSNGEQFRVTMARALAESADLIVLDEFTSVVDRGVAKIGSAAVSKAVRRLGRKFVAVTCHYDVTDWLQPDWIVEMPGGRFTRRSLRRRPRIRLEIARVDRAAWDLFKRHHYLDTNLHVGARCFVAFLDREPVAFASAIHSPGRVNFWREHRTVCLPDFQGVGIGNILSEYVASVMVATGKPYHSTTGNPAMILHRARSPVWLMTRRPSRSKPDSSTGKGWAERNRIGQSRATDRLTAGFRYVGPARATDARGFGLIK